ncbi:MAG: hypothetical protein IH991_00325 [Planctomycetes bacterium]|nr:hypothetical protein [Planctomycetota bacterium]
MTHDVLSFVLSEGKRCVKLVASGEGAGEPNPVPPRSRLGQFHHEASNRRTQTAEVDATDCTKKKHFKPAVCATSAGSASVEKRTAAWD